MYLVYSTFHPVFCQRAQDMIDLIPDNNLLHFKEVKQMNKALHTDNAPAAIGPYSQAIVAGDTVYVSGQLPVDPSTGNFAGDDIASQTRQSLTNIRNILESGGFSMKDVVKTTVLLANIADFTAMNEVYAEFFEEPYPARAAFQVAAIPKGALVEIEAVAHR